MKNRLGSIVRTVLVVLMGATAAMTLLGAVGTSCLAWNGDKYGAAYRWIVPYMPTYQTLVYVKLVVGIVAILVCYAIVRGDRWFYIGALATLLAGGGAAAVQMYYSSVLQQKPFLAIAPTNVRFFITVITLIAFVLVRFPGVWNKSGLGARSTKPGSPMAAGGVTLVVTGLLLLSTPIWAGPSHMLDGYNLVDTLIVPLLVDGIAMVVGGAALFGVARWRGAVKRDRIAARITG